jgi:methylmalonyl-CoA mutase N-terminal domain/subunit
VRRTLDDVAAAAQSSQNLMPPILSAVRAYATIGEICAVLSQAFGEYSESYA